MERELEPGFADVYHGWVDVELRPGFWVRVDAVISAPPLGAARVLDLEAKDDAGAVVRLEPSVRFELQGRFIQSFHRGGGRGGIHKG